jgi:3-hydroxyacyl-CoA dehydrogenase
LPLNKSVIVVGAGTMGSGIEKRTPRCEGR